MGADVTDWIGREAAGLAVDERATCKTIGLTQHEISQDAPAESRRTNAVPRETRAVEDVWPSTEVAKQRNARRRAIDRAAPVVRDRHIRKRWVESTKIECHVRGTRGVAIETGTHACAEGNAPTALTKGDPSVLGRAVVVDLQLRVRDRLAACPPNLLEAIDNRWRRDNVTRDRHDLPV